jgi:hypothetical protein
VQASRLLVARDDRWQSNGQVLIPSMRRNAQRMAFLIVQHDQCTTAQDFPKSSYQSTWNQVIRVDGEAQSIDVENWKGTISCA